MPKGEKGEENKSGDDEDEEAKRRKQVICLPYMKGQSEKIEKNAKIIKPEKLKLAF